MFNSTTGHGFIYRGGSRGEIREGKTLNVLRCFLIGGGEIIGGEIEKDRGGGELSFPPINKAMPQGAEGPLQKKKGRDFFPPVWGVNFQWCLESL